MQVNQETKEMATVLAGESNLDKHGEIWITTQQS